MADLTGLNTVIANLQKEVKKIEGQTLRGLIRAGIMVLYSVEKNQPLTPVDLGNLRASRFLVASNGQISEGRNPVFKDEVNRFGKKFKGAAKLTAEHSSVLNNAESLTSTFNHPVVIFGFSAYYAAEVHELTGVTWNRQGSGGKFFEKAIDNNTDEMLKVIAKEAEIK